MIAIDLDDLIRVRELVRKHFANRKVMLELHDDPEDGSQEMLLMIQIPDMSVDETIDALDKFDDESYNLDLIKIINVHTRYV